MGAWSTEGRREGRGEREIETNKEKDRERKEDAWRDVREGGNDHRS